MSLSQQESNSPAECAAMVEESAGRCGPGQEGRGEEKCDFGSAARRQRLLADQSVGRATSGVACNRVGRQGF